MLAQELQELQDDFLAEQYSQSGCAAPPSPLPHPVRCMPPVLPSHGVHSMPGQFPSRARRDRHGSRLTLRRGRTVPADSKYVKSSWAQMSVLDSLMGQLHTEVRRETGENATVEVRRETYISKGYSGDWRSALRENSKRYSGHAGRGSPALLCLAARPRRAMNTSWTQSRCFWWTIWLHLWPPLWQ